MLYHKVQIPAYKAGYTPSHPWAKLVLKNKVIDMGFSLGIVGLPNVGKSTLFNALTGAQNAAAANYPFCTIEPNKVRVPVPDGRLATLAHLARSKNIIADVLEFVDIAGLIRGASQGEGLGNAFLSHIRNVDALGHVLRCFEGDVVHVEGSVDPLRDLQILQNELIFADYALIDNQLSQADKKRKQGKMTSATQDALEKAKGLLDQSHLLHDLSMPEKETLAPYNLLTLKPFFIICNVGEHDVAKGNDHTLAVEVAYRDRVPVVRICAELESQCAELEPQERALFLQEWSLAQSGLDAVVQAGNTLLNRLTFFTVGPQETRAWCVVRGACAPQAAGVIHSDFEKFFIRAETIGYDDYMRCGGESGARAQGCLRAEGKTYVVQDGDVMHFLHGAH